jgi:hypothetical protein
MLRVQKSQSQPPEDNRSSEEVIKSERCAIPREVYNDIAILIKFVTGINFKGDGE